MKKILTIIIILTISSQSFACSCMILNILDRHAKSDFVAAVNILSVDSDIDEDYLNLEIEIIDLYKGNKTNLLKIRKSKGGGCAMYAPENTKWLIYAAEDENDNLIFGYCSGPKQLEKKFDNDRYPNAELSYNRRLERELDILKSLKNENIEPVNTYDLHTSFSELSIENFKGFNINSNKAFYEITIATDLSVKNVKSLKKFDDENLSDQLIDFIKKNIYIYRKGNLNEIPDETKIIIGLYYHQAENKRQSIILPYAY